MTAILIFVAILVAAALGVWLVIRSRQEPGGRSAIHPDRTGNGGAPLGEREAKGSSGAGSPGGRDHAKEKDVERLRQEDAERPGD